MTDHSYPKTERAFRGLLDSALALDLAEHVEAKQDADQKLGSFIREEGYDLEHEKDLLARLLTLRLVSGGTDEMDSRLARAVEGSRSKIDGFFGGVDLGVPQNVFTVLEQLADIEFLLEETLGVAEEKGWADPAPTLEAVSVILYGQQKLFTDWLGHLSRCDECLGAHRSEPIFPAVNPEELLDTSARDASGGYSEERHSQENRAVEAIEEAMGFPVLATEEQYEKLMSPDPSGVAFYYHMLEESIVEKMQDSLDAQDIPPEIISFVERAEPIRHILGEISDVGGRHYLRVRIAGRLIGDGPAPAEGSKVGAMVCPREDLSGIGSEMPGDSGEDLSAHIEGNVLPKLNGETSETKIDRPGVLMELETNEGIFQVMIEETSGPGSSGGGSEPAFA